MAQSSDPLASLLSGVKLLLRNLHNLIPEKLTDSNYPAWSLNVKTALEANLLLGWIDGHEAAPPKILSKDGKENPNPKFQTWIVIDTQIRACLLAVISPSVHKHVRNFTTSADLWNALAAQYNSVSTAHIYQLRDKLHTLRKGTKTITQYLDEVATILTDLDALNEVIPERDVVNAVIRGLPHEYSSFKQNIRMNNENISLNQLSGWLTSEEINLEIEQKLRIADSASGVSHSALYTNSGRGRGRGGPNGRPFSGQGSGSGRSGRSYGRGGGRGPSRDLPVCQICSKRGHSAATCWYRYDDSSTESNSATNSRVMHATTSNQTGDWYLDTGANTHVTHDLSQLQTPTPYHGTETITVVDNDTNLVRYTGPCEHGLYTLPSKPIPVVRQAVTASTWHRRLGHPAPVVAKSILSTLGFKFSDHLHLV
ncbi:unnamed protein product [Cuscuta campestris]|uniref:Retrotransposon Copia-like N-terminal domain-containing protein n=1 Tax=Cuscuta campestris TaxID=132261 RepID=A0A484N9D1_9ASTE|nr:unnamed protein product [Cuscuta campestris]